MKLAILTRLAGYNMGSTLQAYAMSQFIKQIGFPNIVINYNEYSAHWKWNIKPTINSLIFSLMNICPFISNVLFKTKYSHLIRCNAQMAKFKQFEKEYIPLSKRRYNSISSLKKDFKDLDACICGSDQIWSPYFFDPAFSLSFIDSSRTKKIAYAPSIGITDINMIGEKQRQLMQGFDALSCREREGAELIEQITKRETPVVLDPTLMLDFGEWEKIANKSNLGNKEKYILTYFLHTDYYQDNIPHEFIENIKKKTGLPVYNISLFNILNNIKADKQFTTIGPIDFLSLIKNAEWICTNSFHCCIFSFIFRRKFFVSERIMKDNTPSSCQNSRIYNLMTLFNLEECIVNNKSNPNIEQIFDYKKGLENISKEKEKSVSYIYNALSNNI